MKSSIEFAREKAEAITPAQRNMLIGIEHYLEVKFSGKTKEEASRFIDEYKWQLEIEMGLDLDPWMMDYL